MFGIDTSAGQVGLDMVRARAEGVEFNIVKAVAAYRPEHTVAEGYQSNIDRTVAAGLLKGHYLVVNSRNTPEASAKFLAENVYRYSGGDVLALDNEPLDSYPTFWRDSEAARFFRALHAELGHAYERMWLYCPASLTRANAPWPECAALGVKFWWVAYGSGPDGHTPDHEPSLQGSLPRWDVHQFTSDADVAGFARVDGNYSPHKVTDLFGGVNVGYLEVRPARGNINTPFGPRPKPTPTSPAIHYGQDYGWGGGDGIYAARGGIVTAYGYVGSYGNRLVIQHGRTWFGSSVETWYCHLASNLVSVGAEVSAGQHVAWMGATGNVTAKHLHFELRVDGVATDPEPYFDGAGTAGGGSTPIEEDDMYTPESEAKLLTAIQDTRGPLRLWTIGGGIQAVGPGGKRLVIPSRAYVDLLIAAGLTGPSTPRWEPAQADWMCTILGQLNPDPVVDAQVDAILSLSPDDAARLAADISSRVSLVVTDGMVAQIAEAVAGKTSDEVVAAIRELSFVTVIS